MYSVIGSRFDNIVGYDKDFVVEIEQAVHSGKDDPRGTDAALPLAKLSNQHAHQDDSVNFVTR